MILHELNSYHRNIKLTLEVHVSMFLNTEMIGENRNTSNHVNQIFNKSKKFFNVLGLESSHWI